MGAEPGAVRRRFTPEGRTMLTALAERQIDAHHPQTIRRERAIHGDQERSITVRASSVRENKSVHLRSMTDPPPPLEIERRLSACTRRGTRVLE